MTVQRIDDRSLTILKHDPAARQGTAAPESLFRDTFARLAAAGSAGGGGAAKAADAAAEFISLEMMRTALGMGSPVASDNTGSAAARMVLAAGDALGQAAQPAAVAGAGGEGAAVAAPPAAAEASSACAAGGCPPAIDTLIGRASRRYGVDAGLIKAVVHAESDFKATAVSPAGARGLMQLMPATAAGLGVTNSFDPEQNIMAGTRFLKDLLNRYGGDIDKTLAAYNWGPGNLSRGKGKLPEETRNYLVKVKRLYDGYRVG